MRAAAAALVLGLCACGGGEADSEEPPPAPASVLTGVAAVDGRAVVVEQLTAKGAAGPSRTSGPTGNVSTHYTLSAERLAAPYMVSTPGSGAIAVAVDGGRVNVTPLTTLQAIALFGQDPVQAFGDYGDASRVQIALIDASHVAAAQADATDFIQRTLGVRVRSGGADFVTSAFEPVAGDPMWDTLAALDARIAALGAERYAALLDAFTRHQRDCRLAQVQMVVAGQAVRLCPSATTATTDAADNAVLVHEFASDGEGRLTLRVRQDVVLDAAYVATRGGARYTCRAAACAGITLGAPAFDETRGVTLQGLQLDGPHGGVRADGRLTTAMPGISLPSLACLESYVHVIEDEGGVVSGCADNTTAQFVLSVNGTLATQQGASNQSDYVVVSDFTATQPVKVDIVLDGADLVGITAITTLPDGAIGQVAKCRGAGCRGVGIGPATVNGNLGIETATRTVTLDGTELATVLADGSLAAHGGLRLKASLRLIGYSNVEYAFAKPPDRNLCEGEANHVRLAPEDTPRWVYALCPHPTPDGSRSGYAQTTPVDGGGLEMVLSNYASQVSVRIDDRDRVVAVRALVLAADSAISESFGCEGFAACDGVQVGAADASGGRRVAFGAAQMHNTEFDGYPFGPRTANLSGGFDAPPAGSFVPFR